MNKWQHTRNSLHISPTWRSRGKIILLRMNTAYLGNGAPSIWSWQLRPCDQYIWKITVKWLAQTLPGSGSFYTALSNVRTSFSLTDFRNVAPWFQAVNHPSLCQPSAPSAPSVSGIRRRRAGTASRAAINARRGGALATHFSIWNRGLKTGKEQKNNVRKN